MCAYCEEGKPLYQDCGMTKEGVTGKVVMIYGNRVQTLESAFSGDGASSRVETSDFTMEYCPKCGKGLTKQTTDVQRLREMDKR